MRYEEDRDITVTISDEGPGMDQAFIAKRLFEPMSSTKQSGLGIGAYQALCLVRDIGGTLDVNSELGRGTAMIVRLPLARPLGVPVPVAEPAISLRWRSSGR
jgi:C4-dicarboxylate-specific signal transduction histidine kinase